MWADCKRELPRLISVADDLFKMFNAAELWISLWMNFLDDLKYVTLSSSSSQQLSLTLV